jgi:hypothetical protein
LESSDAIRNQNRDADPLLAFVEERLPPNAAPQNSAHSSATTEPVDQDLVAVLRNRITDAESVIQKSQETIAALHTRVETLVCSVADLNKRLDRERNVAHVRSTRPSLLRKWQPSLPRDWTRVLPHRTLQLEWQRVLPRDWARVQPRRLLTRAYWERVLPRDRQHALVLGTVLVMATLAIVLVALLQAVDAPVPSAAVQAAVDIRSSGPPRVIVASPEATLAPPQQDSAPPQLVQAKMAAAPASEPGMTDSPPSVPTPSAPRATVRPANANVAPARAGQYVGSLTIDSDPSGDAFVNRRRVGRTPVTVEDLRAGSHLIWIERDGYRRFTRVVAVPANRVSRVSIELERVVR